MSTHRSYFSRNNTLLYNSFTNVGLAPYTEIYFGSAMDVISPVGYSRFIFDLDLTDLVEKVANGIISTGCTGFSGMTHTLKMVNTSTFDKYLINGDMWNGRLRATSFDLNLIRIPKVSGDTGDPQTWDEGVGSDYYDVQNTTNFDNGLLTPIALPQNRSYSQRPSNWFQRTTLSGWSEYGIYSNTNTGLTPFSSMTIVDTQHFEVGNENISFNMTNEINSILSGGTTGSTGWIISFPPQLELLSGLTQNYSVAFFDRSTQTFYEPYLETTYDDLIEDDRNTFYKNRENKLYLYSYIDGDLVNLDTPPSVIIVDSSDNIVQGPITSCLKTKGVYEITVSAITSTTLATNCTLYDIWSGITYNGVSLDNITNQLVLLPYTKSIQLGPDSQDPILYGFDYYGIKQDEKIINTDVRKVGVIVKKAYSTNETLKQVNVYYRIYVREGQTEVEVQDWTKVNRSYNQYYFIFDTRDKIPNEYYIDLKVYSDGASDTYKKQIKFQIVNRK
jgi:hypothetical protein